MPLPMVRGFRFGGDDVGAGPPVVLFHGLGGHGLQMVPLLVALKGRFRVVSFELPGHGGTTDRFDMDTLGDLADHLGDTLDELGVRVARMVGVGFGGALALELANRRPALADRVITVEADVGNARSEAMAHNIAWEAIEGGDMSTFLAYTARRIDPKAPDAVRAKILEDAGATSWASLRWGFAALRRWKPWPVLKTVPVPVILCRAGTPIEAKDVVANAPRVRIAKLPGGHYPHLEQPDSFTRGMVNLIRR